MLSLLLTMSLWAETVIIQGPRTTALQLEKHFNDHPNHQSYVTFLGQQRAHSESRLNQLLKKAQFEFIKGSLDEAKKAFTEITELALKEDWPQKSRENIHYAFLRLSQLGQKKEEQRQWIKRAIDFAPDLAIDNTLFPPPMVETYSEALRQRKVALNPLPEKADSFDQVLVNGKPQDSKVAFLRLPESEVRVSFWSNRYQPQSFRIKPDQLEALKLATVPLAEGSCHQAQLTFQAEITAQKFYLLDDDCLGEIGAVNVQTFGHRPADLPKKSTSPTFLRSKWFWIGASVITAGLLIHQNQPEKINYRYTSEPHSTEVKVLTNRAGPQ